jgi:hypothetical protein
VVRIPEHIDGHRVLYAATVPAPQREKWRGYSYSPPANASIRDVWPADEPGPIAGVTAEEQRRILQRLAMRGVGEFRELEPPAAFVIVEAAGGGGVSSVPLTAAGDVIWDEEFFHSSVQEAFESFEDLVWAPPTRFDP